MIRSSKPSSLVCPLATICGSKLPLRSRGIASSIAPSSPSTVLLEWPLRLLSLPRPARSPFSYPRCSLSSAPSARSSSFFLSSLKSPSSPSRSCGELYPCSSSSITSSLIARAMSVIPLLHRVHHGSNLHKISDTLHRADHALQVEVSNSTLADCPDDYLTLLRRPNTADPFETPPQA